MHRLQTTDDFCYGEFLSKSAYKEVTFVRGQSKKNATQMSNLCYIE